MTIPLIAGLIVLILVISVFASALSHKREEQAAERRQRVAELRSRIQESQELLDGLQTAGLDASVRAVLVKRIHENLLELKSAAPETPAIDSLLRGTDEQLATLRNQTGSTTALVLPDSEQALTAILKRLRRLLQLYSSLHNQGHIPASEYSVQWPRLLHAVLRFEVEGYMKLGNQAAMARQIGTARNYYLFAHGRLVASPVIDEYTQAQLAQLQALMDRIDSPVPQVDEPSADPGSNELSDAVIDTSELQPMKKKW